MDGRTMVTTSTGRVTGRVIEWGPGRLCTVERDGQRVTGRRVVPVLDTRNPAPPDPLTLAAWQAFRRQGSVDNG